MEHMGAEWPTTDHGLLKPLIVLFVLSVSGTEDAKAER
jgi:hypothetical protein